MLIEQIIEFELKGSGPPGHTCRKGEISWPEVQVSYYLFVKN